MVAALAISQGCATSGSTQRDYSHVTEVTKDGSTNTETREITTEVSAKSLAQSTQFLKDVKALQTDKTQSFGAGSVSQQTDALSQAVMLMKLMIEMQKEMKTP